MTGRIGHAGFARPIPAGGQNGPENVIGLVLASMRGAVIEAREEPAAGQRRLLRALFALVPPLVALAAQLSAWSLTRHVWFLFFYPAVFLSSWIGGLRVGLFATAVSAASVLWFIIPPEHTLIKPPGFYFPIGVFVTMGVLFAVFHDRLRRSNERLKKAVNERRVFAALIENSSDFIGIAGADGRPIYVNPAGRRMVGLAPDHPVESTRLIDYYPPEERSSAADVIVQSTVDKGHWQGETYLRNWQTGESIPVSDTHFVIRDPDGDQILGMGTVTRDISDIRRARDALERANQEVTRLYEKTKELDELKTQFFASVSHELRTPLALILGPTERLLRAPDTPEVVRRDLQVVVRNARTLLGHVNDLLDVAKLELGRMKPEYEQADLASLARFVAGHFEVLSKEKGIALELEAPDELPAQVDPDKVQRILLNLVSNAFKFTPANGRVRLTIRGARERVLLEVADSGPGIPPDKRDIVFERFRQLEGGATRRWGGTGLGLAIARELAVLHGGSISISEAPEGGALFVVDLPRNAPAGAVVRPATAAVEARVDVQHVAQELGAPRAAVAPAVTPADGARVLVVEDNPEMNRFLCESLAPVYDVATAFDGEEGLRQATQLRPDLVLTDIMMPAMSGDELVHAIRSHPALDRVPILLLTAKADDELRTRLLRDGAQDYLTKPFSVEELRARIHNLIVGKRALDIEAQLASLVEQAPDGIFIADLDGRYTDVNIAGCRMLGYEREEIVGRTILDFLPDDGVEQLDREREQLLRGAPVVSEWALRRKDGTWLPVEVSAKILPDGRWQGFVRDIGERKRLEAALQASHADLVRAQSVAQVGSWRLDVQHDVLQWSDEEYRIFGVAPGTPMTYAAFLACVHPDDRAYVDREWDAALRGQPYDIEHRIVVGDEVRWVREKADLELDEKRALVGGIGVTLDITSRKQAEEALRLAEAKSSGILSISADAIVSIDKDQRITLFNDGAEKIFGHVRDEVVGKPLEILIPERFRVVHRQHVERFAAGGELSRRMGQRYGSTIFGLRKNGEEFPADAAVSKLEVGGERILTIALRDITEEKRIEREQRFLAEVGPVLATTLEHQETLSKIAGLAVRDLADFCIVETVEEDGEARRLKVLAREPDKEWVAEALLRVPLDRTRPHLFRTVFETRRPLLIETVTLDVIQQRVQSEEHLHALRGLDAKSILAVPLLVQRKLLGVLALVSSTRAYGPPDLRLAEELAHRAALSIENARLYRAANRASQVRDDVLGIVAHDLRNPLNSIVLQASLLQRRAAEPEHPSRKSAELIERAANRMNRLIQDLLDVTRLEAGRLSLEHASVPTVQAVSDAIEAHKPQISAASLELQLDVAPDLPDVWADRDRLLQVFENLIGNALKFTEPGGRITIGAAPRDGEVSFWVADTGSGIAAEDVPHLFNRFWQARKAGRRGAGLGLPIVEGIVEAHGGRIWVESAPGRGSTFFFTIPTRARAEAWQGQPAAHGMTH